MAKFGLMQTGSAAAANGRPAGGQGPSAVSDSAQAEALEVLMQLQYKREEAREMIQKAFSRKPTLSSAEEILNEVYRQKKADSSMTR